MGFLSIFFGKSPEEYEQKGDVFFEKADYGAAKIEYETALSTYAKKFSDDNGESKRRIEEKISKTRDVLALHHKQSGDKMCDDENYDDAIEKYQLASELAVDEDLKRDLEESIRKIEELRAEYENDFHDFELHEEENEEEENEDYRERMDEYFYVLTGSLPDKMSEAYRSYGNNFKVGYVALNQGDFTLALAKLSDAAQENTSDDSYIPLELANVHLNLTHYKEARSLLEDFLQKHPDSLQAYHFLCEVYWEQKEFDRAQKCLSSCPEELQHSLAIQLLLGQTLFRSGSYEEAKTFYHGFLQKYGWNDVVARELALTYEALGEKEEARDLFSEIMCSCRECRCQVDPFLKQKYADLCMETGQISDSVLELYLSLVHENPKNKADYYQKISHIYSKKGNKREERRYQAFAKRVEKKEDLKNSDEENTI
ncbi:MAG: tetratricopeptide repeat protein [bacterium]